MRSSVTGAMVALYPSPAGATECELDRCTPGTGSSPRNPVLERLEPDAEALVVNRLEPAAATATRSRRSTSATGWSALIKASWDGHLRRRRDRGGRRRSSSTTLRGQRASAA